MKRSNANLTAHRIRRRFPSAKGFSVALAVVALTLASSAPATAATLSESERGAGLWYVDSLGISSAHAEGLTGKSVRIAVVDDGINLQAAELRGAKIRVHGNYCLNQDTGKPFPADSTDGNVAQHGTSVVAMLVGNGKAADGGKGTLGIVPDAEIDFYATGPVVTKEQQDSGWEKVCPSGRDKADGSWVGDAWEDAMNDAVKSGASIVSVSLAGSAISFRDGLVYAAAHGVTVVASARNPGNDSIGVGGYPAAGNGTVSVNAVGPDNKVIGRSVDFEHATQLGSANMGVSAPGVRILSIGRDWAPKIENGTSYATPLTAGVLALAAEKYPKATQNQILQSLVSTTDASLRDGTPSWDPELGFGIVSLPQLLERDPGGLQDLNPLFVSKPSDSRCLGPRDSEQPTTMKDCYWAQLPTAEQVAEAASKPSATGEPSEPGTSEPSAPPVFMIIGLLLGGLIVIAAGVFIPIAVTKKSRSGREKAFAGEARTSDGSTSEVPFVRQHPTNFNLPNLDRQNPPKPNGDEPRGPVIK
ncbi:S8 family peptidase [Mycetocola saprophilus]|uniref:S8 family peptidase n=1 Tax=Mycetocola saprophilus TaxID=76636 RepID=UPI003BEFC125